MYVYVILTCLQQDGTVREAGVMSPEIVNDKAVVWSGLCGDMTGSVACSSQPACDCGQCPTCLGYVINQEDLDMLNAVRPNILLI